MTAKLVAGDAATAATIGELISEFNSLKGVRKNLGCFCTWVQEAHRWETYHMQIAEYIRLDIGTKDAEKWFDANADKCNAALKAIDAMVRAENGR